ncbi:MAG: hypothetical protein WD226_01040 [Planctomycetota bacterium]
MSLVAFAPLTTSFARPAKATSRSAQLLRIDGNRLRGVAWMFAKSVRIDWEYLPDFPSAAGKEVVIATYDLAYKPTCIAAGLGGRLYVAGVDQEGDTIIERWDFEYPNWPVTRAVALERSSVITASKEQVSGRHGVANMFPLFANDRIVVKFSDSNEVWMQRAICGGWEKVASPTDTSVLHVPALAQVHRHSDTLVHVTDGVFLSLGSLEANELIYLVDSNYDNSVDRFMVLGQGEAEAAGYKARESWVPY